jgi:hypothetical protein
MSIWGAAPVNFHSEGRPVAWWARRMSSGTVVRRAAKSTRRIFQSFLFPDLERDKLFDGGSNMPRRAPASDGLAKIVCDTIVVQFKQRPLSPALKALPLKVSRKLDKQSKKRPRLIGLHCL